MKIIIDESLLENKEKLEEILSEGSREVELLTNSRIIRLDINFVASLKFNKIGEYPIIIGPYPQNEEDIEIMSKSDVTAVLNVQTDLDMAHRQINWIANKIAYESNDIKVVRVPIKDFNSEDLISKLKLAIDALRDLISARKLVYVHCTAGMSRAAATVVGYLVIYESFSLDEAYEYVKSFREIICPNLNALSQVIKNEITSI